MAKYNNYTKPSKRAKQNIEYPQNNENQEYIPSPERKPKVAKTPTRKRDPFYSSQQWKIIRFEVLKENDGRCSLCGKTKDDIDDNGKKLKMTVDHIIPRKNNKDLELDKTNLRVLCDYCHQGRIH